MKSKTLILTLLVAGSLAAWLLLRDGGAPQAEGGPAESVVDAAANVAGASPAEPVESTRDDARLVAPSDAPEESEREALPESRDVATEAEVDGLRVRVLDASGAPTAGIPVALFARMPDTPLAMPMALELTEADGMARMRALDEQLVSAPEDIALSVAVDLPLEPRVERSLTREELAAALEGSVLELVLPPGAEALAGPLRVRVLDAAGEPAIGVEVGYRLQLRGSPDKGEDVAKSKTMAPDGVAELDRREEASMRAYFSASRQPFERVVSCRGALIAPPSALVPDESLGRMVTLQLEPTGSVDVEVVGPDGARIREGAAVQLSWTPPGAEQRAGFRWLELEEGAARIEHIACGMSLTLGASLRASMYKGLRETLPGPVRQGERLRVSLRFEAKHPALAGRLLGPDGAPVAEQRFSLEHDYSEPLESRAKPFRWSGSFHATDAEGRFALPWSMAEWTQAGRRGNRVLRFTEQPPISGAPPGWSARYAEIPAPRFVAGETTYDVGDVTLGALPLLVSGQVVDEAGDPVRGAFVQVRYALEVGERTKWHNHNERPMTPADGRFLLRTHLSYERIDVSAWKTRGGSSERKEVPLGARDVRLVFVPDDPEESRGSVSGALRADDAIPWTGLELRLRRTESDGSRDSRTATPFGGGYRFVRLLPGTYALELVSDGHGFNGPPFVLFEEDGLLVRAGAETKVPAIDLRGQLRMFEYTVLDHDGARVDRLTCQVLSEGVRHAGGWIYDGRLAFVTPAEVDRVQVAIGKHAPVEVLWSPEPGTLTLD